MSKRAPAQSETVGNMPIVGVIVMVASTVALGIVGNINNQIGISGDQPSQVDFIADTTGNNFGFAHNGGDSL